MELLDIILLGLFVVFFAGTVLRVLGMLERKRVGGDVERARLVFFFLGCLMLVCLLPLKLFELLTGPILGADLAVVTANFVGFALTYDRRRSSPATVEEAPASTSVRAYQIYYKGKPYGLITKPGIDTLLAHKLLKRQRTVEFIDDFKSQAQRAGVGITLLSSKDGQQHLVRVEGPPGAPPADA